MKEESELKNQPDEIDLDKNSKNFRNLDRPTPVVQAKTAEEMAMEWANKEGYEHPSPYYSFLAGYEAAQFTPSAKSVEVEEAKTGRTHLECPNCGSDVEQAETIRRLEEENERLRDEGIRLLNGIRRISEIIDDELAESICRELLRP